MDINKWTLLGGGAALGLVAGMWDKVKGLFHNVSSIAVVNIKIDGQVAYAISMYIVRNFKRSRLGDIAVTGSIAIEVENGTEHGHACVYAMTMVGPGYLNA